MQIPRHGVGNIVRFSVQGSLKVSSATVQVFIGAHSQWQTSMRFWTWQCSLFAKRQL
jgi:hypothetical protein